MTEKLPIHTWSNETEHLIHLFGAEILDESHIIGLREEDEPFLFTDYQWFLVPLEYHPIIHEIEFVSSIFSNYYIVVQYGTLYWIAERLIRTQ
jgi:hypothetical protein